MPDGGAGINVQLNYPQCRAYAALFDEAGKAIRWRTAFIGWGRGVGKSKFLRLCWWLLVAQYEKIRRTDALEPFTGVRIVVLMPTLKQFKDVHWSGMLQELVNGEWSFLGARLDKQSGQVTFPGGSFVKPFPANEYNARTALGLRADVLVVDECDDVPASVYDAVAVPWLSEPWSLGLQLIAGTPNKGRHGLWWRTYQQGLEGARLRAGEEPRRDIPEDERAAISTIYAFHATYKDAPETVGAEAAAKAKATTPKATFEREWEANPDAGEGLVYAFVNEPDATGFTHVREPPRNAVFQEFLVGQDHGWVDPGSLIRFGILGHGEDAVLWALEEHYESEVPNHVWDARAKEWRGAKFWPDPSRPDRIHDLRSAGLDVGQVDNDILAGIARVADLLFPRTYETTGPAFEKLIERRARLYVSPKCKNVIREFGLYRRKRNPDGTYDEMPVDKDNHAMDPVRYVAMGRFGRLPNHRTTTTR